MREEIVYKFFHAMQTRAAATFFKSVLSSMAFAKFSLGLESGLCAEFCARHRPCKEALHWHPQTAAEASFESQGRFEAGADMLR